VRFLHLSIPFPFARIIRAQQATRTPIKQLAAEMSAEQRAKALAAARAANIIIENELPEDLFAPPRDNDTEGQIVSLASCEFICSG